MNPHKSKVFKKKYYKEFINFRDNGTKMTAYLYFDKEH